MVFSVFLAALYSLSLYRISQHGKGPAQLIVSSSDYVREHLVLFLHSFPLFVLVASYHAFTPNICFDSLNKTSRCGLENRVIFKTLEGVHLLNSFNITFIELHQVLIS